MCLEFPFLKQTYWKTEGHDNEGTEDLNIIKTSYLQYYILFVMNSSKAIYLSFMKTLPEIIQDIFISNIRIGYGYTSYTIGDCIIIFSVVILNLW